MVLNYKYICTYTQKQHHQRPTMRVRQEGGYAEILFRATAAAAAAASSMKEAEGYPLSYPLKIATRARRRQQSEYKAETSRGVAPSQPQQSSLCNRNTHSSSSSASFPSSPSDIIISSNAEIDSKVQHIHHKSQSRRNTRRALYLLLPSKISQRSPNNSPPTPHQCRE